MISGINLSLSNSALIFKKNCKGSVKIKSNLLNNAEMSSIFTLEMNKNDKIYMEYQNKKFKLNYFKMLNFWHLNVNLAFKLNIKELQV